MLYRSVLILLLVSCYLIDSQLLPVNLLGMPGTLGKNPEKQIYPNQKESNIPNISKESNEKGDFVPSPN
uniref:Uncharacterized protein n=1 Tax=Acrobeloides nanus TaxID=290746 RepID=A0A914C5R9_9BILA